MYFVEPVICGCTFQSAWPANGVNVSLPSNPSGSACHVMMFAYVEMFGHVDIPKPGGHFLGDSLLFRTNAVKATCHICNKSETS